MMLLKLSFSILISFFVVKAVQTKQASSSSSSSEEEKELYVEESVPKSRTEQLREKRVSYFKSFGSIEYLLLKFCWIIIVETCPYPNLQWLWFLLYSIFYSYIFILIEICWKYLGSFSTLLYWILAGMYWPLGSGESIFSVRVVRNLHMCGPPTNGMN